MDTLQTYRLFRRMNQYPSLLGLMRSIFMDVLSQRGLVTRDQLYAQALKEMEKDNLPPTAVSYTHLTLPTTPYV